MANSRNTTDREGDDLNFLNPETDPRSAINDLFFLALALGIGGDPGDCGRCRTWFCAGHACNRCCSGRRDARCPRFWGGLA